MLYVTFADGYVAVSSSPWGRDGKVYEIGPVEDEFADTAVDGVARMLRALGHAVLTPDEAMGHWYEDAYYPTAAELADEPAVR